MFGPRRPSALLPVLLPIVLAACAASPWNHTLRNRGTNIYATPKSISEKEARYLPSEQLLPTIRAYVEHGMVEQAQMCVDIAIDHKWVRKMYRDEILRSAVSTGMTNLEAVAAAGLPNEINEHGSSGIGITQQWVYWVYIATGSVLGPSRETYLYIYLTNDIVTSWSS